MHLHAIAIHNVCITCANSNEPLSAPVVVKKRSKSTVHLEQTNKQTLLKAASPAHATYGNVFFSNLGVGKCFILGSTHVCKISPYSRLEFCL